MPTEADHQRRKGEVARRVAEVLRQARTARGMSQEEVANAARISVFAYGCLERGRGTAGGDANPTLDTVVRVFAVLGIDVYEWNAGVPPLEPPEPPAHGGSN